MIKKYTNGSWNEVKYKKYGNKTEEFAEFPVTIKGDGNDLTDYSISGNMSQASGVSPTTPIQPQECGELEKNVAIIDNRSDTINNSYYKDIRLTDVLKAGTYTVSYLLDNRTAVAYTSSIGRGNISTYLGDIVDIFVQNTPMKIVRTITLDKDECIWARFLRSTSPSTFSYNVSNIRIEEGKVSYGIKIPISSGGENLFIQKLTGVTIASTGVIVSDANYDTYIAEVSDGETYTVSNVVGTQVFGFFTTKPALETITYNSSRTIFSTSSQTLTVPAGENIKYIGVRYNTGVSNAMLNLGSTALPYSPYNRTTTPVYLGEVPTTRKIKKLVFDGTEGWVSKGNPATFRYENSPILHTLNSVCYCSHFKNLPWQQVSYTNNSFAVWFTSAPNTINIRCEDYSTVEDFKSYLAAQYAAGTPVTVWYVLAEPTTGIVNEPLRKIGNYADTVSYEQAGVQIPTNRGNTVIDVLTELKPSEMSLTYKTWSEANAKIYQNGAWTDTPTPPVTSVVYGWHVDPSIADSSNAVTYLEDAVGMTPAAMGTSTFDYGSWEDAFFMPKPCMVRSNGEVAYYLDPNDYSKKADGTPSDVANPDFDGNAMMEWGKIWYKFAGGETDGEGYFYVSNVQVDDSYHCWCNYDSKDNITDHFYTAIYNGTGTTKLRSISGVALTSANENGGTTVTQEVERATANNTTADVEWYTDVWADRLLINALLVLIGKSLNTQATFGRGLDTGGQSAKEAYATGTLNDKGLFWGVTADGNSAVKVFGMENWWGCAWHRTAGCISIDRALKIKLTYGTADGSTVVGYNQSGDGYISDGTIPSSSNYVKAMVYNQYGYVPNNVSGGSASTYYADYFYQNTGTRYLLVGGVSGIGVNAGAFSFNLNRAPSHADWIVAASLSFKPLAMKG